MSDISINSSNTESAILDLNDKIKKEIIEAAQTSKDNIVNAVINSAGYFIESLINEVGTEVDIINEVGELLIAIADYIKSAADDFESVDATYNTSKI